MKEEIKTTIYSFTEFPSLMFVEVIEVMKLVELAYERGKKEK